MCALAVSATTGGSILDSVGRRSVSCKFCRRTNKLSRSCISAHSNLWCTSRRMSKDSSRCLCACIAVGGDHLRHCPACSSLATVASQSGRRHYFWVVARRLRVANMGLPLQRWGVQLMRVWAYVACRLLVPARHSGRAVMLVELQRVIRAIILSVSGASSSWVSHCSFPSCSRFCLSVLRCLVCRFS